MTESTDRSPFVVSFDWLAQSLGQADLKIVDASWYLPAQNRDGAAEFAVSRIPGAVFFNQDRIVAPGSDLPHTIPDPDAFARAAGDLGLSNTDTIIVYDGPGMFTAPRVWWLLRIFGAANTYVLDGGFDAWKAQGLPLETGDYAPPSPVDFNASLTSRRDNGLLLNALDRRTPVFPDCRRPRAGPFCRGGARTARRHALRPHARCAQCPFLQPL
jgi:thiosulfate/3-mercaptopyruvate sulfurtransferase